MQTTLQLIERVQRGDAGAADELFKRYETRLLFIVRARMGMALRHKENSDDVAQEAVIRCLTAMKQLGCSEPVVFAGLLKKKVEEAILDRIKYWTAEKRDFAREAATLKANSSGSQPAMLGGAVASNAAPAVIAIRHEEYERLQGALTALRDKSEDYWELVVAFDLEGRKFEELAAERGSTPAAIKQKRNRARAALARIYRSMYE